MERAVKHLVIATSAGEFSAMHGLITCLERDFVSRADLESTLTAYNNSCAEMRSEARDNFIQLIIGSNMNYVAYGMITELK